MSHDHSHDHAHGHHHHHHDPTEQPGSEISEMQVRVRALESILVEKGYVDPAALDEVIESYEKRIGPHIGAKIVARAWIDPDYRQALLEDATKLIRSEGLIGASDHIMALENTPKLHHVVVCTLCSCYPIPILGLPPMWYKSKAYRSRTVVEPRGVLRDFGLELPADTQIRVWDATAELRYIVVPMRPEGTENWDQERLASLVTRDCMIGTAVPQKPAA